MLPALWNYYPLVTSDTGAYIQNAYQLYLPNDRPITYSYFLLLSSLRLTLWLTIFFQSLLLSFLIVAFIELPLFKNIQEKYIWILFILITLFTSCSWFSSQLMPDIFTAIIFLASINLIYASNKYLYLIYGSILFCAILMHNSNLIISLIFYFVLLIVTLLYPKLKVYRKKAILLTTISLVAWSFICGLHYISGNGFKPSKSSHVFLIAKLAENGILKDYLNEHCTTENYRLCAFKNELPNHAWDFIWNDGGAFARTGYWDSSESEYSRIIKGTLTQPKFLIKNLKEGIKASGKEFILTDIGDGLNPQTDGTNPYWKIQQYYGHELKFYLNSKQNQNKLSFRIFNQVIFFVFITNFIMILILYSFKKLTKEQLSIYIICLFFCLLNAATTGALANILARLNSRSIWLLPFLTLLLSFEIYFSRKNKIANNNLTN